MGILRTVAKVGNPNLELVDLRGMWSRKDATQTLAGMLVKFGERPSADVPQRRAHSVA